ncbi:hypothetical protein K469DRAFT_333016 [Zopfia rhizophila CBS 207.26]|uniref:Uncharacterized protein n=1 Tax=Zopfia rhizophila CBS 207.26 TaxID=1314779 RepID=A0A6A6DLG9_9PEZI|nr:hypothetical protein K469DRAFT_333016 [Zopfia rhizophila CBS 207.26]
MYCGAFFSCDCNKVLHLRRTFHVFGSSMYLARSGQRGTSSASVLRLGAVYKLMGTQRTKSANEIAIGFGIGGGVGASLARTGVSSATSSLLSAGSGSSTPEDDGGSRSSVVKSPGISSG